MTAMFKSKPPEDLVVKFYLITDESVVAVPFEFKDVPVGAITLIEEVGPAAEMGLLKLVAIF